MGQWSLSPFKCVQLLNESLDKVVVGTVNEVTKRIVLKSPVFTGAFRGNWRVTLDVQDFDFDKNLTDPLGDKTIADGEAVMARYRRGQTVHVQNNAFYGDGLEAGGSARAPNGVLRVVVVKIPGIVDRQARKVKNERA